MNIIESIQSALRSRVKSPLFGSFLISWCAWNWEILLVFLSSNMSNADKISYINTVFINQKGFYDVAYYNPVHTLLIPMGIAVGLYIALPRFNHFLEG